MCGLGSLYFSFCYFICFSFLIIPSWWKEMQMEEEVEGEVWGEVEIWSLQEVNVQSKQEDWKQKMKIRRMHEPMLLGGSSKW